MCWFRNSWFRCKLLPWIKHGIAPSTTQNNTSTPIPCQWSFCTHNIHGCCGNVSAVVKEHGAKKVYSGYGFHCELATSEPNQR